MRTGGGLVFLLVAAITGLGVAHAVTTPVEMALEHEREVARDRGRDAPMRDVGKTTDEILRSKDMQDIVAWITGSGDEEAAARQARYMIADNPALLSAI